MRAYAIGSHFGYACCNPVSIPCLPLNSNLPVTFGLVEDAQLIEKEACEMKKRAEI